MQKLNKTTFQASSDDIEVVIGDEKQAAFYPRVKLKKWENEANFSVGLLDSITGAKVTQDGDTIVWRGDKEARFYPINAPSKTKPTGIRRVIKNKTLQPYEASAEYEFMRHRDDKSLSIIDIATYVTKPMLMHFDAMPTGRYTEVDDDGLATDYDHKDKSAYQPDDMPMPKVGKIPANRIYSPYTASANPYYSDEGLVFIDIQYGWNEVPDIENIWCDAVIETLKKHDVKVSRPTKRTKLYFEHKGRQVKFHSAENARGALVAYFNLKCMYNKAYDYYKPGVEQDVRDKYAYGIQEAHPEITIDVVNQIIELFAKKLKLPIADAEYSAEEWEALSAIIPKHKEIGWIRQAERKDANWFYSEPRDGFEFEFDLAKKPTTNVFDLSIATKGLAFYKQDALTQAELEEGCRRDPDVVGSYAVYHADGQQDNQYKTGKAFHIYRPFATDASGLTYFCDMDIDEDSGTMRITVPQEFLNEATYPVTIDPTFGYTTSGGSTASALSVIRGTVQTAPVVGSLVSISAYINTETSDTNQHEGAVYRSSDGVLIAQSNNSFTNTESTPMWVTMPISGDFTAVDHILAFWGTSAGGYGGVLNVYYDSTVGKSSRNKSQAYSADNWPTPITWDATETDRQYSIYVTYATRRYWVGGTGTWNATAGTKWATSSGGAGGAAVPTAADDVFLDGNSGSGTVTISGARVCRSFTCTGFTGTLTSTSTPSLTIGNSEGGAMTLAATMTVPALTFPTVSFVSTSNNGGAGWPITTAGISVFNTTFDGVGGKWVLQDSLTASLGAVTLTNGTLDTNNQSLTISGLQSSNSNTRTLTLGTSTITCNVSSLMPTFWGFGTTTNLTFSGSSSTIVCNSGAGVARTFDGGGLTYGTFTYNSTGTTGALTINGNNTFSTLNLGSGRAVLFATGSTNTVTNWNATGQLFGYQRLSGTSGDYISAPDSAALSITGDITILTRVAMDTWAPFPVQMLVAKRAVTGNQRSFHFNISSTGFMSLVVSTDGTAVISATADAATGFSAGSKNWVLVTREASTGKVRFYKADGALDNPAATDFTQIGTEQTPGTGNIFDGTAPLEIGSSDLGTVQPAAMNVYRTIIYNGVFTPSAFGGTKQFDADFTRKTFGANSFTESSSNAATVTMNGTSIYGDGRLHIDSTGGSTHNITGATSSIKSSDYLSLTRSVASGGVWYAGGNSINGGSNTGWIFQTYGDGRFLELF